MMNIYEEVKNNIEKFKKNNLIVAVSGGIDSVVLLDVLAKLMSKKNIVIAHFDHGLRKTSQKDKDFVKNFAKKYGFKFVSQKANNLKIQKGNLEENARVARYNFLMKIAKKNKANYIVTAHHADDQIETVFMNFKRGSHILGFSGMDFKTEISPELFILRPMLNIFKKDIINYQKRNNLTFTEDETNKNNIFLRNNIRYNILGSVNSIHKLSLLKKINDLKVKIKENQKEILLIFSRATIRKCKNSIILNREYLKSLKNSIVSEIIKLSIYNIKGDIINISQKNILNAINIIFSKKSGLTSKLTGNLEIILDSDRVIFINKPINGFKIINQKLKIGLNRIKNQNFILDLLVSRKPDNNKFVLDYDKLKFPLKIISYEEGMRIKIKNVGTKKLQDVFIDNKIEKRYRKSFPVLIDAKGELVAIIDLVVSESCFPDRKTVKYLLIDIKE